MRPQRPKWKWMIMQIERIPFTHGMEIEQFPGDNEHRTGTRMYNSDIVSGGIPSRTIAWSGFRWHRDPSGPQETDFGPYKSLKSMLSAFLDDVEETWDWHNQDDDGSGAGSHLHFHLEELDGRYGDDTIEAWTITWNSLVDLTPFFAPFLAADWTNGFRDAVDYWASPQTTRWSQSTTRDNVRQAYQRPEVRQYESVTLNSNSADKPVTIELRLNEAHPTFACFGMWFMRRTIKRCLEEGWSVKLNERVGASKEDLYDKIYNVSRTDSLISRMQEPMQIVFEEGRGIPGTDRVEFESMWDVLMTILNQQTPRRGTWGRRVLELVRQAGRFAELSSRQQGLQRMPGPERQNGAMWRVFDEEFEWDVGVDKERHE